MATYNRPGKDRGPDEESLFARDLVGNRIWALFIHWAGELDTVHGVRPAVRAEVYEITLEGAAHRAGTGLFFQKTFVDLPFEQWSVGVADGPDLPDRNFYTFRWPAGLDATIDMAMSAMPDRPVIPEPPASDGSDTFPPEPETAASEYYEEEPF